MGIGSGAMSRTSFKFFVFPRSEKGVGLVEAMVAAAILAAVIAAVFQLFVYMSKLLARLERRVQVNAIVVRTGALIQSTPMLELARACRDEMSVGGSLCVNGTETGPAGSLQQHAAPRIASMWKQPYGWAGEIVPPAQMKMCLELVACNQVLQNQLIDLKVQAWWFHQGEYRSQIFTFRRGTL